MNNNKNTLEHNLKRQLKHAGLSPTKLPTDGDQWLAFLRAVNRSYNGNKDSRYLLEQSLEESSKEMRKLYSDLKKETEQRILALQEAKEKTRFMANMSHEIRTPIHGILGSLEIVKNSSALDDNQKAFVGTAFTSAENLLDIINNILDFSKISTEQLELENVSFDLHQLVNDTHDIALMMATDKPLEMDCIIEKNIPTHVMGDPTKVRQILTNILGNAVKFTDEGSISTKVSLLGQTDQQTKIRFEIKDTGIGISDDMQRDIFDAFTQEDVSTTRQYGGTGLGLTIIKELVHLMDGECSLESSKDLGSRFWVDINFTNTEDKKKDLTAPVLRGLRALAVDDLKANRTILEYYLSQWGIEVDLASSAKEGMEYLKQSHAATLPYDVIIVDWFMPGMDGLKFSQALNSHSEFKNIPKIMLSSTGISRSERMRANLAISLTKPIRKSVLNNALLECVKIKQASNHQEGPSAIPLSINDSDGSPTSDVTDILLAEDNDVNALIAMTMMDQMGLSVKRVTDGQQAIDTLKKSRYRIILMDMHMPVMDGYEATKNIRNWEHKTNKVATPIIALTANALIGDREKCIASGMDDYLPKPVRQEHLKKVIKKWVDKGLAIAS